VAERILDAAAERTALRPVVVRLGQVCGDGNGTWNKDEWFPSLIKSALTLHCLPSLDGVSQIPTTYMTASDRTLRPLRGLPRRMLPQPCLRCRKWTPCLTPTRFILCIRVACPSTPSSLPLPPRSTSRLSPIPNGSPGFLRHTSPDLSLRQN
jgi:hypothetical protein